MKNIEKKADSKRSNSIIMLLSLLLGGISSYIIYHLTSLTIIQSLLICYGTIILSTKSIIKLKR